MRYLLDAHTLLWYALNDPKLSGNARTLILDPANDILVSTASFWEIAIKVSLGKLKLHRPYQDFVDVCLNSTASRCCRSIRRTSRAWHPYRSLLTTETLSIVYWLARPLWREYRF